MQRDPLRFAQAFFEFLNVFTEICKIPCDGKFVFANQMEPLRLSAFILHPEHLGQRHGFVEMVVAETTEDHRVTAQPAQRHGFCGQAFVIFFALVVAAHIGCQAAFARFGTGGLVEDHPVRGNQQGRECVHQCGFSRADVARQQRVFTVSCDAPNMLVKGAPVEHLKALKAKTRRFKHIRDIGNNSFSREHGCGTPQGAC